MHFTLGLVLLMCSFLQGFNALPWRAVHGEAFAFAAVVVWMWGVAHLKKPVQITWGVPIVTLLCFNFLIAVQYVTGKIEFGGDALVLMVYVHLCIAAFIFAQNQGSNAAWPIALAVGLLVVALLSAVIALSQSLGVWSGSEWILQYAGFRRPGANLGQPNHLSTLLIMGAVSLIYLDQSLRIGRVLKIVSIMLILVGMGITESRTGLVAGAVVCCWWFARRKVFADAVRWYWVVASALGLVIIMLVWPPVISYIQEGGPVQKMAVINTTTSGRLDVWQQLWSAAWMEPWTGWGLRGVSAALNAVQHNDARSLPFTYAHNIVLDFVIGAGFPLTLVFMAGVGWWLWGQYKKICTVREWYAMALLIPFGIHSLFEYPFAYAYFLVPVMLAVGMLDNGFGSSRWIGLSQKIIYGFLCFFGSLLIWIGVEYMRLEEDFLVARFEALNVGQTPADYRKPDIVLLTQLKALVEAIRSVPAPHMPQEEIDQLHKVALRFPWAPVLNSYALSLALNGNPQEALRQMAVLRAVHGEGVYRGMKAHWEELAETKFPQLRELDLP